MTSNIPAAPAASHIAHAVSFDGLAAASHPLRATLSELMQARRLPGLQAPARLLQIVRLVDEPCAQKAIVLLRNALGLSSDELPDDARYQVGRIGEIGLAWERHTEFATTTLIAAGGGAALFDAQPFAALVPFLDKASGPVIRASLITLLGPGRALPDEAELAGVFSPEDLVVTDIADGRGRVWTDFRLHDDGFGRLLVTDRGFVGSEHEQYIRRLQELGNYRKVALLGLPVAQQATLQLGQLEGKLAALVRRIADDKEDDATTLEDLTLLSAELASLMEATQFRMDATRAYSDLCLDRIRRLGSTPVKGFRSLGDFTERRLIPAVRTCEAYSRRLEACAQRASWASDLLRTRVDTKVSRLNSDLLASMNHRTHLQLRLQQTVESLSIVAISYYLIGVTKHILSAAAVSGWDVPHHAALGVVIPLLLVGLYFTITRARRGRE